MPCEQDRDAAPEGRGRRTGCFVTESDLDLEVMGVDNLVVAIPWTRPHLPVPGHHAHIDRVELGE